MDAFKKIVGTSKLKMNYTANGINSGINYCCGKHYIPK